MPAPWSGGAECRIVGRLHGGACINVFHLATNEVINDQSNLDDLLLQLAQAMLECAVDTLLPAVTSDYELVQCDAKRIFPVQSDPIVATAPPNSVGQRGPTSVSFAASLVNLRTGGGGRRGRGKKFLPPPGEADISTSEIDNATLLLIAAFLTCLAGKFLGANPSTFWILGIYSKTTDKELGHDFNDSFRIVTSLNPVAQLATMHSRKVGVGA